jgi:predicted TIM-barrel fold metal-dependent hydrolase
VTAGNPTGGSTLPGSNRTVPLPPQPFTAPCFDVPRGACNCHVHVMGPIGQYPQSATRPFTVGPILITDLGAMLTALRLDRVVIVPMLVTGTDHSYILEALRQLGRRARAVAIVDPGWERERLGELHEAGFRAARVLLHSPNDIDRLADTARLIGPFGWHIETYGAIDLIAESAGRLRKLGVPVVLDHFAGLKADAPADAPGHTAILRLLESGAAYVKLSAVYRTSTQPDYSDAAPLARALIAANPDRILWGGDWPHPGISLSDVRKLQRDDVLQWFDLDDGKLLNLLADWAPDPAVRHKILVANPTRVYAFD